VSASIGARIRCPERTQNSPPERALR
jgi:hypothetical protein